MKLYKRILCFLLAMAIFLGCAPYTFAGEVHDHGETLEVQDENVSSVTEANKFKGKKVSILSHSMSTYAGVSNNTSYNSTIGKNDVYYTEGRHGVYLKDTWWMQTIDALDMELLVNNSWSGSCIFQPRKGEASIGYGDRAVNLHNDHTGEEPDIIFVYLGCNDFAYFKDTFGTADSVDYETIILDNGDGTYTYAQPTNTCEAYAIMLHKVEHRYTNAEIYCMTSTARREVDYTGDTYPDAGQPTAYVAELQKVAKYFGYPVIDLENAIPKDIEIFDKYVGDKRAHANALGMDRITNEILSVMLDKESEIRHVTADHGAVAEQAVLLGGSYKAEVKIPWGYSIVVTMGGKDITIDAYKDGVIAITEVTGDIHVETVINRTPQNFRWEFRDGILTSIGASENVLTKLSGTVANNILNDGIFQLNTPVVLKHDLPWAVEWKCAEDWRGVMLASQKESATKAMTFLTRTKGGQLCFGTYTGSQYDNYGIDISDLNADTHIYRLENRIAVDGSNMVWLYVDGEEIGPMNNYFIGSKDQNTTSDWISGKDFVFSFIGMTGHALRNCQLDYLSVTECDHTYKNSICTGCGAAQSGPVIIKQPTDGKAALGERYCVTVEAEGEGLKYTWYGKDAGATTWFKSGVTDNTYDDVMTVQRAGRLVYCVITDMYGNSVTTDTVKLVLLPSKPTHIWDQWTQSVTMAAGTYPTYGGSSTGYYSEGQQFGGILYSSTFREGTDVLWNLNPSTYYSAVANPASLLYTIDNRGRVFNESAWAGSVCSTTALKACGYSFPYTTAEIQVNFGEKTDHSIDNLEFGDILWTKGHVAGIIGVTVGNDDHVASVKIIEQASYVRAFEITAQNWDTYFSGHWTHIYRGDFDETKTAPEEYPENLSIIFERGNNTYVTDTSRMLFYIPTASTVYLTKDGTTTEYVVTSFPTQIVNNTTVYDLSSLFAGVGDYYFHTDENTMDICIKVINCGEITISGATATLSGYENCELLGYRVIKIVDESKSNSFNFFEAPECYTSEAVNLSFQWLSGNTFAIENIPQDTDGWKLEVYYDTGCGWARFLSKNVMSNDSVDEHAHNYSSVVTPPTCTEKGYTTYTCECGDSYVSDYVEALGHSFKDDFCTVCGTASWDTDSDGTLEILAIGNSFSVDALEYAYQIAEDLGIEKIVIGNLYIGGCSLEKHAKNAKNDTAAYTYYFNDNGTWTSTKNYKISTALTSRDWDYITLQQWSATSGVESSYNDDLTDLIDYVKTYSEAKLGWHMTWAYQQNSTHSSFPTYNKDR